MIFNKTAFYLAVEKKNIEIINLLLSDQKVDVNIPCILLVINYKIKNHFI